jgi:hypothetical protein
MGKDRSGQRILHFDTCGSALQTTAHNFTARSSAPGVARQTPRLSTPERAPLGWRIVAWTSTPGRARGLLRAWPAWEFIAQKLWPTTSIPDAPHSLIGLRIVRHHGEPLDLPDGTRIERGTIVGEIHCNNKALLRLMLTRGNPFAACRQDLRGLSAWAQRESYARNIEGFYARTILSKAAPRLGFVVHQQSLTLHHRFEKIFYKGLLMLYNPEGLKRLQHGSAINANPFEAWISRRELIRRYGRGEISSPQKADASADQATF